MPFFKTGNTKMVYFGNGSIVTRFSRSMLFCCNCFDECSYFLLLSLHMRARKKRRDFVTPPGFRGKISVSGFRTASGPRYTSGLR